MDSRVHGDSSDSAESDGSSSSGEDEEQQPQKQVEWLATGREKRSTAGNRMKSMLANEGGPVAAAADDSDLELLFAEGDDDVAFTDDDKDDGSDAHMESSSDDDEDNDAAAADDLAGEKELQRQAREKKMADRKRKAQDAIPMKFRKKARIKQPPEAEAGGSSTPTAAAAATAVPPPRPKKKIERTSWLPSQTHKPTRASERATTKLGKEQLHQQMIERETKRKRQLEIQEKKAKRLEALKKPPMTQAERLAEAALVEKRNSKSLNRWEEAEKQREEVRLAKLAALNNGSWMAPW
jgi:vacuolar protein sorting-associated protein 72